MSIGPLTLTGAVRRELKRRIRQQFPKPHPKASLSQQIKYNNRSFYDLGVVMGGLGHPPEHGYCTHEWESTPSRTTTSRFISGGGFRYEEPGFSICKKCRAVRHILVQLFDEHPDLAPYRDENMVWCLPLDPW